MGIQPNRDILFTRAQEACKAGDHRAAQCLLRHILRDDPEDAEARVMLTELKSGRATSSVAFPTARSAQGGGRPLWGFRSMSMVGTTVLLLLLVVALILPEGAILASKDNADPAAAPGAMDLASVSVDRQSAAVRGAVLAAPRLPSGQVFATSLVDDPTGVVMAQNDGSVAEPPVPQQGGTCISGFIIDRYEQARGGGWTVTLTDPSGASREITADSKGRFKFEKLGGGTWTVGLEVPGGWQPYTLASFPVVLSGSGSNCANVRFKVEALPCLKVTKLDASGKAGLKKKVGIAGWEMTVTNGSVTQSGLTDGQGIVYFYDLLPGTWTVEEEAKIGWRPADGQTSQKKIKLESPRKPGVCESLTFVNEQVHNGCVQVQKLDPVGDPLKGWTIKVSRVDGTQKSQTKTTNAAGYATFSGLALGEWNVEEKVKDGWRPMGPQSVVVDLTVAGQCEQVTFANEPLGCVDGYKINHLEQGLSGWNITASNLDTGEQFSAVTNNSGYFKFDELPLGSYEISEEMQTGWEPVTPDVLTVDVTRPFKCQHVRFKNKTDYACVDVFKKDATDGSGLPGWEITVKPAYGGSPIVGVTTGTGWVRFNGLTPGTYVISEKMQAGWYAVSPQSKQVELQATGTCKVITFKNSQKTPPKKDPPKASCCRTWYRVQPCDTLSSIAFRYRTTVGRLATANGICNPNLIYVGQVLCIP